MDKFLAMKMFMATVETQGFSAAARKMAVAISSVTRLVDALEAELGTTLFNRSTRQVSLTEAGLRYYTRAREIFEALEAADASVADRGEEPAPACQPWHCWSSWCLADASDRLSVPVATPRR